MKGNNILIILFFLGICIFSVCCATDKVALELVEYVNQDILSIAELEKRSLERYAAVTGKNYTSDQKVHDALKDYVIPNYKRFRDLLRNIRLQSEALKNLHRIYIHGTELLYSGFRAKLAGLEKKDETLIRAANEKIEKGRIENERWRKELMALYERHGVAEKGKKKEK